MSDDIVTRLRQEWEYGNNAKGCDYEMFAHAADEIERLRAKVVHLSAARAEIERLRQLGDTMAYFVRSGDGKEMYSAVYVWEEARRG